MDLEGLEDIPDFWDIEGGDFDDDKKPTDDVTVQAGGEWSMAIDSSEFR